MKLKSLNRRGRATNRAKRPRTPREPRPAQARRPSPERVWSLLLPPGFPSERR
jgi:hypothetical protein